MSIFDKIIGFVYSKKIESALEVLKNDPEIKKTREGLISSYHTIAKSEIEYNIKYGSNSFTEKVSNLNTEGTNYLKSDYEFVVTTTMEYLMDLLDENYYKYLEVIERIEYGNKGDYDDLVCEIINDSKEIKNRVEVYQAEIEKQCALLVKSESNNLQELIKDYNNLDDEEKHMDIINYCFFVKFKNYFLSNSDLTPSQAFWVSKGLLLGGYFNNYLALTSSNNDSILWNGMESNFLKYSLGEPNEKYTELDNEIWIYNPNEEFLVTLMITLNQNKIIKWVLINNE